MAAEHVFLDLHAIKFIYPGTAKPSVKKIFICMYCRGTYLIVLSNQAPFTSYLCQPRKSRKGDTRLWYDCNMVKINGTSQPGQTWTSIPIGQLSHGHRANPR